jgi:Asp-tRNA(Asn)/Glu-tRNA(Gln) amidotransferase A subunit family amidase
MNPYQWDPPISAQVTAASEDPGAGVLSAHRTRQRIEDREPDLRAWVALSDDLAAQAARVQNEQSPLPLRGVSLGVKDLIDVAGLPTRAGSPVTSADPVGTDADCVTRLRSLGVVIQGKTVTTEFGYFAPGATRNPHAPEHTPGGSSSGSAAAVGAGVIPLALGTQTAGSLTRPASFCGAAGMVLAHGTTSLAGVTGLSDSLDALGLLTRSVDDLRTVYAAFTDTSEPNRSGAGAAVFVWHGSALDDISPSMARLVTRLPDTLGGLDTQTQPLDFDDHVRTLATDHATVMAHEAAATRAHEYRDAGDQLSPPLRQLLEAGAGVAAADVRAALARRDRCRELLAGVLGDTGLIVGPAALGPAPAGLSATGSPILSRPWQLLGLPVVVVPGASAPSGLPLGVQIIGLPGREYDMLDLGARLEGILRADVSAAAAWEPVAP